MTYITLKVPKKAYQVSFEDMIYGLSEKKFNNMVIEETYDTRTKEYTTVPQKLLELVDIEEMISDIEEFNNKNASYFNYPLIDNYSTFYLGKQRKGLNTFLKAIYKCKRPENAERYDSSELYKTVVEMFNAIKSNHPTNQHEQLQEETLKNLSNYLKRFFVVDEKMLEGFIKDSFRRIDAPNEDFKHALTSLKLLFEYKLYATYHTTAFAYIKKRTTKMDIERHQKNNSRWFLKLDFSNFFPSATPEFITNQLKMIFPYSEIYKTERGASALNKALSLCFLGNGLPQGTPISPLLTNIMMIPIDHQIAKMARNQTPHLCYTRYADDLLLSSELSFKWKDIQQNIINILDEFNAPFTLKTTKTRYGSRSGRNWNLGMMLNKDNEITIGAEKKRFLKATLHQFMTDYKEGNPWSVSDTSVLDGQISYYKSIEKENIEKIINKYSEKFGQDVNQAIKNILRRVA